MIQMLEMGKGKHGTKEHSFQVATFLLEKPVLANPVLLNITCPRSSGLSLSNPSMSEEAMKIPAHAKGRMERKRLRRSLCPECVLPPDEQDDLESGRWAKVPSMI